MNIKSDGMWVNQEDLCDDLLTPNEWSLAHLFELRTATYRDFAAIEKGKGLLQPSMEIVSSHGQEALRILTQRGFEEVMEAMEADDHDHFLEELIDSLNYFWVLAVIDDSAPLQEIRAGLVDIAASFCGARDLLPLYSIDCDELGKLMYAFGPLFEKLRNRAWTQRAQSLYFDGWDELIAALKYHFVFTLRYFDSWTSFVQYYIAKDNVLRFRLDTGY